MQDASATFETTNHALENFLYWHKIKFQYTYRNKHDGTTVWVYQNSDRLGEIVKEFLEIYR